MARSDTENALRLLIGYCAVNNACFPDADFTQKAGRLQITETIVNLAITGATAPSFSMKLEIRFNTAEGADAGENRCVARHIQSAVILNYSEFSNGDNLLPDMIAWGNVRHSFLRNPMQ